MFFDLGVRDFLDRAETVYPDRVAVVDEPDQPAPSWGSLTYREVARRARAQAANLDALGVPAGGRVAIVSHNAARLLVSFFGVSAWGRILVPVNFRLAPAEVKYIVEHSGAEVLIVDPELEHLLDTVTAKHVFVLGRDDEAIWGGDGTPRPWEGDESATATINYTSGTTARPKGVQLTHRNIWLNAAVFGLHTTLSDHDVLLHTLPMFHCNGWGMPYAVTGLGGRHIVLRKVDGTEILRRIDEHGVTILCAAPAVVTAALDGAASWDGEIPGRDRVRIVVAGAPPPTRTIERVRAELGWEFIQIYGLTETAPLLTVNRMRGEWADLDPHEQARLLGRAGTPALGVRIAVDSDGEVLAQSNHNLDGYWENPEETARVTDGGWFHTGDGGTFSEGYLTIADRKKDVIISGGENVSSIEVEDALNSHPAIREAAVIGIPDEKWGELVTALVVVEGDVTADELIQHCRGYLAGYKCPKRIEFLDALPRTATGKIQKFKLREPFWQGQSRQVN
ncbi:Acyl-CoA synthetase (AMP-forming)/AMP-acid ligase II [Amycolatopsis tolypomycina]|uniref:Acyl-CoA synthetase (AMP-forming)/AMP-acid ligase II n=1 Tax=Amycolatopsis tolypomycina TaxID=208445 RepID=A0A1H5B5J4_9PSEU|nr:AMP-binding protein [Amycolatopsis tolypomycina]SED49508.1 Acyl-CoA synthetase (AMP-forming)/AMP-acid ligase II [Amycolatopsis tolypomycina]